MLVYQRVILVCERQVLGMDNTNQTWRAAVNPMGFGILRGVPPQKNERANSSLRTS